MSENLGAVCVHGSLVRSCNICDLESQLTSLREKNLALALRLEKLEEAGGGLFNCPAQCDQTRPQQKWDEKLGWSDCIHAALWRKTAINRKKYIDTAKQIIEAHNNEIKAQVWKDCYDSHNCYDCYKNYEKLKSKATAQKEGE